MTTPRTAEATRRLEEDRCTLALIDALRDRGAIEVEVDGVKARFGPPPPKPEPLEPAAAKEYEARKAMRKSRTLEDRLFKPLGIRKRA